MLRCLMAYQIPKTTDMQTELVEHINDKHAAAFMEAYNAGHRRFDFMGGRRSGKSYFIEQFLLSRVVSGKVVNVATMTDTQGRLGAYADVCDILHDSPNFASLVEVTKSPKEVRQINGTGRMFFNSYMSGERAKGIACDWLWMNEANNFTEQQFIDLSASARCGVICDRNPNSECWTDRNGFVLLHSDWTYNAENLTDEQIAWFEQLKAKAEAEEATQADMAFYKMYYLGEYAEITGAIFTPANLRKEAVDLNGLSGYFIYADPSAMCGADFFAMVLAAVRDGILYIVDVWSKNVGSRADVAEQMAVWCNSYDVRGIFIEGNGLTGKNYYEEQRASFPNMRPYTNTDNKHGRILGNYEALCSRVVFNEDAPGMAEFLAQCYEYEGKNSTKTHDDNIDAVNSAYEIAHRYLRAV